MRNYKNLRQKIHRCNKSNAEEISKWVGESQEKFDLLMDIVYENDMDHSMRAAWIIDQVTETRRSLFSKHIDKVIGLIEGFKHSGVVRSLMKILSKINLPKKHWSYLFDLNLKWIMREETSLAVKVHGLEVNKNICLAVPELKNEFLMVIEDQYDKNSVGFRSRAKKVIRVLS